MFFDSAWGVITAFFVFVLGAIFSIIIGRSFSLSVKNSLSLYLWHTFFCVAYVAFVLKNGGDALGYYYQALDKNWSFGVGTSFITMVADPFINYAGFSFLAINLVFNIFGSIGLLAVYGSFKKELVNKPFWVRRTSLLVVLLPSVSFWSSSLGKDSLAFMAVGLALWASLELESRFRLIFLSVCIMLLVRPHMAGIMLLALSLSLVFKSQLRLALRVLIAIIALFLFVALFPFLLDYVGLSQGADLSDIENYIERRQSYNTEGGGGIDIASMNFPMQIFTYLFRPLPFEAHSVFALAASLDNILLLFIVVCGVLGMMRGRRPHLPADRFFMWFYTGGALLALALTTANLGISVRQKWMFLPILVFLLLSYIGRSEENSEVADSVHDR
jgi:hypothetical protein